MCKKLIYLIFFMLASGIAKGEVLQWDRAAYYDARYPTNWAANPTPANMRYALEAAGYTILDADQLKTWMDGHIADGALSVVVFCPDIAPDTVAETNTANCTLRRYLDAGGKIVFYADIPFYNQGHLDPDNPTTTWGDAGAPGILGFDTSPSALRGSNNIVQFTQAGIEWGLTETWQSVRPAAAGNVDIVLATDNAANAAAWVKHYLPGDNYRGFVRTRDVGGMPKVDDIIRLAEYSPRAASNPNPPHNAIKVALDVDLSWTAGEDAVSHKVYLDVFNPPMVLATTQPGTTYDPGTLNWRTDYYWQIVEVDSGGDEIWGQVWHFKTEPDPALIIDPHMLGWWPFDGDYLDYSGYGNDGTPIGGGISFAFDPERGDVLDLPGGSNIFVDCGAVGISGAIPRTIACWAKADTASITDWTLVFGFTGNPDGSGGNGSHFNIGCLGGTNPSDGAPRGIGAHCWGWEETIFSEPESVEWHHYAMTYDGATIACYGDGAYIDFDPGVSNVRGLTHADRVHVGSRITQDSSFPGNVSDCRIYDRVLTSAEVQALAIPYHASNPDPDDGSAVPPKASGANLCMILKYEPGKGAVSHTGYFSENYDDVLDRVAGANLGEPPY
ncbi:MAG: LamG domain-containing protein, partial [Planctomycetes bacterium]|nr:LamG domain-containing protein [Planctomycetota bacterium]